MRIEGFVNRRAPYLYPRVLVIEDLIFLEHSAASIVEIHPNLERKQNPVNQKFITTSEHWSCSVFLRPTLGPNLYCKLTVNEKQDSACKNIQNFSMFMSEDRKMIFLCHCKHSVTITHDYAIFAFLGNSPHPLPTC